MPMLTKLHIELDKLHLLNHPFYKAWEMGTLSKEVLQQYAAEYYSHVAAFPRYISGIHFHCEEIEDRQILLGNLREEEEGEKNHPELWKRFAEGLNVPRGTLNTYPKTKEAQKLVDGFFDLVKQGYAWGLGALYAYERQTPAVAKSKIDGLKKFYDVKDEKSLEFFTVHMGVDEWHSDECAKLIEKLPEKQQQQAQQGAIAGAKLLWGFLDGMMKLHEASMTS